MNRITNRALKKLIYNYESNVSIALSNEKLLKTWKQADFTLYEVKKRVSTDGNFEILDTVKYYNNKLYPNHNNDIYLKVLTYKAHYNSFECSTDFIKA